MRCAGCSDSEPLDAIEEELDIAGDRLCGMPFMLLCAVNTDEGSGNGLVACIGEVRYDMVHT